ncbi:MAG TPA: hypothetical protein VIM70_08870 [Clostridium sp.]|uniref:hypothetical protein n=1 Tax=Clostridium sp. TaxID=1506 RepID=UPI002F93726C
MDEIKSDSGEVFGDKILSFSCSFILDDKTWRVLGYKKKPQRGSFFHKFVKPNILKQDIFILRELFISCIATGINTLDNYSIAYKKKIVAQIIEKILSGDGILNSFSFETYNEAVLYFTKGLKDYFKDKSISNVFIQHAVDILGESFKPVWLVNIGQVCVGDTLFCLKTYLNDNFVHPLIDDIELTDYNIIELLSK